MLMVGFFCHIKLGMLLRPRAWLARPPPGPQQFQDSLPVLSMVLKVLHSHQAVWALTVRTGPGRVEARSEACSALSLKPKKTI